MDKPLTRHGVTHPENDRLLVSDLGSTNGTYVNSSKVRVGAPQAIKDNDTLSLGNLDFKVKIVSKPGASSK